MKTKKFITLLPGRLFQVHPQKQGELYLNFTMRRFCKYALFWLYTKRCSLKLISCTKQLLDYLLEKVWFPKRILANEFVTYSLFITVMVILIFPNGTVHNRYQCRKTAVLGCHRCLINIGVEKNELCLNID